MSVLRASWNQRHRLGQTLRDAADGVRNCHHTVVALRADGAFDERAMRTAWRELQLRHPVLGSAFDLDSLLWSVPEHPAPAELTLMESSTTEDAILDLLKAEAARPFDLAHGPLARLLVVPVTGSRTYVQLTVEHLISDGWSLNVLMEDLASLYTDALKGGGEPRPLPELGFPEFVRRQNAMLESESGRAAVRALAELVRETGPVPATTIPGFSGKRTIRYHHYDGISRRVDTALCDALAKRARAARMSRPTLTHAALHDALWRLSGADRVATTLSTANRETAGADRIVGWLSSKVVVASSPGRATDLDAFLATFNRGVLAAVDLAHVPWPRLIAEMTPEALGRHTTEPYVTFNVQTAGMLRHLRPIVLEGLDTVPLPISVGWHDASIATFWKEDADGMRVTINWKTDWYAAPDIEALWTAVDETLRRWTK